jgi:hypothetical protein
MVFWAKEADRALGEALNAEVLTFEAPRSASMGEAWMEVDVRRLSVMSKRNRFIIFYPIICFR